MALFMLTSTASILLVLLAGVVVFGKLDRVHKDFFYFIGFSTLIDAVNIYIGLTTGNNIWMFRVFLFCDYLFFAWYYHRVFDKPLWDIRLSLIPLILMLAYQLLPEGRWILTQSVSWFHLSVFLFFIVQAITGMIRSFEIYQTALFHAPVYWISFARLFYYTLVIFSFILPDVAVSGTGGHYVTLASGLTATIANICLNLLYAFSFLCLRTKTKLSY